MVDILVIIEKTDHSGDHALGKIRNPVKREPAP
jgi:hypothetical protein